MRLMHLRVRYRRAVGGSPSSVLSAGWTTMVTTPIASPEWRPACDVVESATEWILQAELAGLDEDDFEVLLYEDSVVIQGVRPWRGAMGDVRIHLAELRYGPFRLALEMPSDVDRGGVRATHDRGLLTLVLPKRARGQS